jgi:hypothetical protein
MGTHATRASEAKANHPPNSIQGRKGSRISRLLSTRQEIAHSQNMTKYTAKESWRDLEICNAAYNPLKLYLNHQFIKILEDLRVPQ